MLKNILLALPLLMLPLLVACSMLNAQPAFHGTWQLQQISLPGAAPFAPEKASFSLELSDGQRAGGTVACNRWHGTYTPADSDRINFDRLSRTKQFCLLPPGPTAELESRYLARLQQGVRYRLRNDQLTLLFADGEEWRFGR